MPLLGPPLVTLVGPPAHPCTLNTLPSPPAPLTFPKARLLPPLPHTPNVFLPGSIIFLPAFGEGHAEVFELSGRTGEASDGVKFLGSPNSRKDIRFIDAEADSTFILDKLGNSEFLLVVRCVGGRLDVDCTLHSLYSILRRRNYSANDEKFSSLICGALNGFYHQKFHETVSLTSIRVIMRVFLFVVQIYK